MDNKILHEYRDFVEHEGNNLDIIIRSYEKPIAKNDAAKCYTKITIISGNVLYGERFITSVIVPEKSQELLNEIKSNISLFKE